MKVIRTSTNEEIENHLLTLGGGNQEDNMKQVNAAPNHFLIELAENDFRNLVFFALKGLVPPHGTRTLEKVALLAASMPSSDRFINSNWDLNLVFEKTDIFLKTNTKAFQSLVLRDVRDSGSEFESAPNGYYLQDGSHRALGYCVAMITHGVPYHPQSAYLATKKSLNELAPI